MPLRLQIGAKERQTVRTDGRRAGPTPSEVGEDPFVEVADLHLSKASCEHVLDAVSQRGFRDDAAILPLDDRVPVRAFRAPLSSCADQEHMTIRQRLDRHMCERHLRQRDRFGPPLPLGRDPDRDRLGCPRVRERRAPGLGGHRLRRGQGGRRRPQDKQLVAGPTDAHKGTSPASTGQDPHASAAPPCWSARWQRRQLAPNASISSSDA